MDLLNRNTTITNMSFVGALLVVFLHVKPIPTTVLENLIVDFVYNKSGFPNVAVPLFFGISGYLLAKHVNENNWYQTSIKKRIKTLVVPFYMWTLILIIAQFLLVGAAHICEVPVVTPNPLKNGWMWFVLELIGLDFFHLTGIVWYLRSLFFLVLVSPILVCVLKKGFLLSFVLFALLLIVYRYGPYSPFGIFWIDSFLANGFYCGGLLPFTIGIFIKIYPSVAENIPRISLKLGGGNLVRFFMPEIFL